MRRIFLRVRHRYLMRDRRGVVAIFFALALIPLVVVVALAVDYSFYIQAQSQLNLAADAAAMHAVRVASQAYGDGATTLADAEAAGKIAGQQWFAAQLGNIPGTSVPTSGVSVDVTFATSPPGFVSTVGYSGAVSTNLGHFITPTWPIAGSSGSVINSAYLEVVMLIDNSSSMLIGATESDIVALQANTPCSTQAGPTGQSMSIAYSWSFDPGVGYDSGLTPPPVSPINGRCNGRYTSLSDSDPLKTCLYPPTSLPLKSDGTCINPLGGLSGKPAAPCAFACHTDALGKNDYYGLAKSLTPPVTLRLDVVHQAAASVIEQMQAAEEIAGQYLVGVYEFNTALQQQYPMPGTGEASTDLVTALAKVKALTPPVVSSSGQADTYFATSAATLASLVAPAGDGSSVSAPLKNLFIVTDGVEDDLLGGGRNIGPITNTLRETTCQKFKDMGFTVFVLYTPFLPVPNVFYLNNVMSYVEPTGSSAVSTALQACASAPEDYFSASSPADIATAMKNMLKAALYGPGRVSK